uniref:VWFA domain-containing protein n=1 Tax=Esox lucius TaxID=8010 RepID=A0A6Q2Y3M2_ESOLU
MDTYRPHVVLIILILCSDCCLPSQFPTQLMIKEWVDQMQLELVTLADTASAGKSLSQIFLANQNLYTVQSNDAEELVDRAARNIEQLLLKRAAALKTLATAAENFQMEHQWKDEYADGDIVYYNAKDNLEVNETEGRKNRIRPAFKEDPLFKRLTSHNHTAVHIPTDIYDGSTIVLNELNWTEALEDVFKKNREDDPTLLWQVFGSATGLARYYPASPWMDARKTPTKIDLYDVRRRPCVSFYLYEDLSGSVSGLTLKLIRTSVSEMLETLSDDDYVNVVYFNTRVNNTACFDHLVQANVRNKKILKDAIQNILAKGITNYTKGFEFAFEQLYATNITRANCNKIIMLFTDGGEERASAILQRYNADKKVRIFTFSVGQHNYDKGPVQWMACANKGYFYEIPSIGAIRINTQEYLDVLGRPMVLADQQAKQVQWTNVYLDALELGLVITGTLPVFNKTKYKDEWGLENQLILGVMGIDVSLDDIKKLTPRFTIGPNGYYFAIDPNGYVLLHPNLQPKNPKFQEPVTLDFLDAELENDIKVQIRTMMIDGTQGEETIHTLVKTQDERYIDRGVRTYTWAQVNGTDYRCVSGCVAKYHCLPLGNVTLVSRLLLDAGLTADLVKLWKEQTFVYRVCVFSAGEEWTENAETYDSSFYKRTLDNEIYIFTAPYFNSYESGILVSKAVDLNINGVNLKPAVVGVKLNVSAWMNSFMNATIKCKDEICGCLKNDKHVDCVILDDGGFLLMSNQDEYITQIGQFFGEVDPPLMTSLVNTSLYSFNKTYDYQSVCDPERDSKAAAGPPSVYVPTIADMLSIGWWASTAAWSIIHQLFYSLIFPSFLEAADSDDDMSANMFKESCITEQTQYFFENEERSYSGVLDCGNCSRCVCAFVLCSVLLCYYFLSVCACTAHGPDPCELAQNPRYRKGPDLCFDNNVDVSFTDTVFLCICVLF